MRGTYCSKFCNQRHALVIFGRHSASIKILLEAKEQPATSFALQSIPHLFFNKHRFRRRRLRRFDTFIFFLCNSTPCTLARLRVSTPPVIARHRRILFRNSFESNHTAVINQSTMSTNHPSPLARQTSAKKQKTEHEQDEDGIPIPEVT